KKVSAWALANRGAAQTPLVLGNEDHRAGSMELARIAPDNSYAEEGPDQAPGLKEEFSVPTRLQDAWTACATLRGQAPGPWVYTPELWREYRDTLLRWEQLERAHWDSARIRELGIRADRLVADMGAKAR